MVERQATPRRPVAGEHVRMRGIVKSYDATIANDHVDFDVEPGEVHALLGENGAGKTTLMNILFGLVPPDAGEIWLGDEQVRFASPHDALARGIGMVHQHFMLIQKYTVAENVVLGAEPSWNLSLRPRRLEQDVRELGNRLGMAIEPRQRIRDLPIETQQRVEILKLLYRGARTLILDEPTSALGPLQIAALFATLSELRSSGHSVVIVTHKLSEVMEIADRVTVLRASRNSASMKRGQFDETTLARALTGRDFDELPVRPPPHHDRPASLSVRNLAVHAGNRLHAVHGVTFDVLPGEIVGLAGVEGNGQRELVDAIAGIAPIESGQVLVGEQDVTHSEPAQRHGAGLSLIPEDRHGWGLVLDMTLAENLVLAAVPAGQFSPRGILARKEVRQHARRLLEEYDVRPPDPDRLALALSGGNQQKLVLARELSRNPKVLIAANPTQGLDVGATEYVHRRLLAVRESGSGVVLVSHDLDELLKLSDRILVLYRGQILYQGTAGAISLDDLALAMAGTVPQAGAGDAPAPASGSDVRPLDNHSRDSAAHVN
jgi:simple sugar transport system ATP-binding protein